MERKPYTRYSREFKLEAVRLVRERGVSVAQAARDLGGLRPGPVQVAHAVPKAAKISPSCVSSSCTHSLRTT